ncbi:MAG: VOC family protein [Hyphomicrobiales bacterium]|nr:VOC family protein [Hyphomicrobiales bacterium]
MIKIDRIDHLVLTVTSIENTCDFYCGILGLERESFGDERIALNFGEQKFNLHRVGSEINPRAKVPVPGLMDLCLITTTVISDVISHLGNHQITIETGPVTRTGAKGPVTSLYVRDPDVNLVEISTYIQEI